MEGLPASVDCIVTDHAALRWLERAMGIDTGRQVHRLEEKKKLHEICARLNIDYLKLKKSMLTPVVISGMRVGASAVIDQSGFKIVLDGWQILSVLSPVQMSNRRCRKARYPRRPQWARLDSGSISTP